MFSKLENEHIFKVIYLFRKTIPKNQLFYCFFFFLKFISPYLLTHNLQYKDSYTVIFNKIMSRIVLQPTKDNYSFNDSYYWICLGIFIFIILFIMISAITFYFIYSKNKAFHNNTSPILGFSSNNKSLNTLFKNILIILSYIFLFIVLISQHLVEYLFLGIFLFIYSLINKENYQEDIIEQMHEFSNIYPFNSIILLIMNIFTIIFLFLSTYSFFLLASNKMIKMIYGFRPIADSSMLLIFVFLFQFQGIYSINSFFANDYRNNYRLLWCIIMSVLLAFFLFFTMRNYEHRTSLSVIHFVDLLCFICFISGIIEIILFFLTDFRFSFVLSITKNCFEVMNAVFIIFIIRKRNYDNSIKTISKRLFDDNPHGLKSLNYLIVLLELLYQYKDGNEYTLITLYKTLRLHFNKCVNDQCSCIKFIKRLRKLSFIEEKREKVLLFNLIAERDIVQSIITKESKIKNNVVFFLHINYLYLFSNNYYMTLYMCQYYLMSKTIKRDIEFNYGIYEIYRITLKKIKTQNIKKQKSYLNNSDENEAQYLNNENDSTKESTIDFKSILKLDKIKNSLYICCQEYEKIIKFRQMIHTKKDVNFTCKDIIESIIQFKKCNKLLREELQYYLLNKIIYPGEECYLITCYYTLIDGKLPVEFKEKISHMKSYSEIYYTDNLKFQPYIILSLSIENEFIITYATPSFIEKLGYIKKDIIGTDIHDNLLGGIDSLNHFAQMKMTLINNIKIEHRESFIFTKSKFLYPVIISIKTFPSKYNLSIIIKFNQIISDRNYYTIVDNKLQFQSVCQFFEKRFLMTDKLLRESNILLSQFFGIDYELLIKRHYQKNDKNKKYWFDSFKQSKSILTTVKSNQKHMYYNEKIILNKKNQGFLFSTVSRKGFVNAIEKIQKYMGNDKSWAGNINSLYEDISLKKFNENYQLAHISDDLFQITLQYKNLGNSIYYVVKIKDLEMNITLQQPIYNLPFTPSIIGVPNSFQCFNSTNSYGNILSLCQSIDLKPNEKLEKSKFSVLDNNNSKSIRVNDSNLQLNSYIQPVGLQNANNKLFSRMQNSKFQQEDVNMKQRFAFTFMKKSYFILLFILIVLNGAYIIVGDKDNQKGITLFYIRLSAYSLSADIFYNALGCIRGCLITNKLLDGEYAVSQSKTKIRANDMMEHLQELTSYINQLNKTNQINEIYTILNTDDTYYHMISNGKIVASKSCLIEEIYNLFFYARNFNPNTTDKCRLKEIFYNNAYLKFDENTDIVTTLEEKIFFYLFANTFTVFEKRLSILINHLSLTIESLYQEKTKEVKIWVSIIIICGGCFYGTLIACILLLKIMIKNNLLTLFEPTIGENILNDNLNQLSHLIQNFNQQECSKFETKNFKINSIQTSNTIKIKSGKTTNKKKEIDSINRLFGLPKEKLKGDNKKKETVDSSIHITKIANSYTNLKLTTIGFIISIFTITCFIALEIGLVTIILNDVNKKLAQCSLSGSFLNRIPKLVELLLFSILSVFSNNMNAIVLDHNQYNQLVLTNHYNVEYDLDKNTFFNSLGDSYFAAIYYQFEIGQENILKLCSDTVNDYLPITVKSEEIFNEDDTFCIYISLKYVFYRYPYPTVRESFQKINSYVQECRPINNGINQSGFQVAVDLLLQNFISAYVDFFKIPKEIRVIDDFFFNPSYLNLESDVQLAFKVLHNTIIFLINDDIESSYVQSNLIDTLLGIISIIFSVCFSVGIIIIIATKLERYNIIIEEFNLLFKRSLAYNIKEAFI